MISVPDCTDTQMDVFLQYISNYLEREICYPKVYRELVLAHHGYAPEVACFETPNGEQRVLGRYLNFLRTQDITPPIFPTWRRGVNPSNLQPRDDIRLDYSVWSNSQACDPHSMTLGRELIPFAAIDIAGHNPREMAEFDLLCFRYAADVSKPTIVAWSFHDSCEDEPVFEPVADSFVEFLELLSECSGNSSVRQGVIDKF